MCAASVPSGRGGCHRRWRGHGRGRGREGAGVGGAWHGRVNACMCAYLPACRKICWRARVRARGEVSKGQAHSDAVVTMLYECDLVGRVCELVEAPQVYEDRDGAKEDEEQGADDDQRHVNPAHVGSTGSTGIRHGSAPAAPASGCTSIRQGLAWRVYVVRSPAHARPLAQGTQCSRAHVVDAPLHDERGARPSACGSRLSAPRSRAVTSHHSTDSHPVFEGLERRLSQRMRERCCFNQRHVACWRHPAATIRRPWVAPCVHRSACGVLPRLGWGGWRCAGRKRSILKTRRKSVLHRRNMLPLRRGVVHWLSGSCRGHERLSDHPCTLLSFRLAGGCSPHACARAKRRWKTHAACAGSAAPAQTSNHRASCAQVTGGAGGAASSHVHSAAPAALSDARQSRVPAPTLPD